MREAANPIKTMPASSLHPLLRGRSAVRRYAICIFPLVCLFSFKAVTTISVTIVTMTARSVIITECLYERCPLWLRFYIFGLSRHHVTCAHMTAVDVSFEMVNKFNYIHQRQMAHNIHRCGPKRSVVKEIINSSRCIVVKFVQRISAIISISVPKQ